ncbi:TSEN54 [Bugula neritina]|uniref:TSEN54 n=1 Tax=Bugula neritina TaxID=10212 RepID=A0A7J7J4F8_BUGNE|nr:TSEN54 [Bugula neritina]
MKSLAKTVNNENNQLVFDVYQPTPNFRKSDPGKPLFRALVIEADDEFPSLASLCSLTSTEDDVPFYYAICDCGDITFFSHMQETLNQIYTILVKGIKIMLPETVI